MTRLVMWVRQGEGGVACDSSSHVGKTGGGEWHATRLVMWVRQGEESGRRLVYSCGKTGEGSGRRLV